jgi:hypothetical protein
VSLTSALLHVATGALQGVDNRRTRDREEALQNLELLSQLSRTPGFSIESDDAPSAPAPPAAPQAPGADLGAAAAGSAGAASAALPSVLASARAALGTAAPAVAMPATGGTGTSRGMRVGHLRLEGRNVGITFNPAQTGSGQEARNRTEYARLQAMRPGTIGDYDPSVDYGAMVRKELGTAQLKKALQDAGYSDSDAELLARYNIDADAKRAQREQRLQTRTELNNRLQELEVSRLTQEAVGLIESGADPDAVGATLHVLHPDASVQAITRAVGAARGQSELRAATVGQKNRSNQRATSKGRTVKVGGMEFTIPPDSEPASGATARGGASRARPPAPNTVLQELIDTYGDDDEAIKAELRRRGYSDED